MTWTTSGTVSISNNSKKVYGAGTLWVSGGKTRPGDEFIAPNGARHEVESVQSNTELTLVTPYMGATASGQPYALIHTGLLPAELAVAISDLQSKYLTTVSQLYEWETSAANTVRLTNPATGVVADVMPLLRFISSPIFSGPVTAPQYFNVTQPYGALQVGGVDVMRFGSDRSGQLAGFRNLIINGDCRIAQYGSRPVVANNWAYGGCDRIAIYVGGTTASGTIQQYPSQPTQSGFAQGARISTTGAGSFYAQQRIEAANTRRLNGKTAIFSCVVLHSAGVPLNAQASIGKPAATADVFSSQTTLASSAVVTVPSGVLTKLYVPVTFGASDASLGVVAQAAFPDIGAVTDKDFYVGDWQLEPGSIITPLEQRPIGVELSLCQRYLPAILINGSGSILGVGQCSGATTCSVSLPLKVTARVPPTGVQVAGSFNLGNAAFVPLPVTSITFNSGSVDNLQVSAVVASGLDAGNAAILVSASAGSIFGTGCEL